MKLMKRLSYVDFWGKMFIFYLFFVDVHNWHGAPKIVLSSRSLRVPEMPLCTANRGEKFQFRARVFEVERIASDVQSLYSTSLL